MKELRLTNFSVLIDDEDEVLVLPYKWRLDSGYAKTGQFATNNRYTMSEIIMGDAPLGYMWDHRDGNKLNNQKSNLRLATKAENSRNLPLRKDSKSGVKGVYKCNITNKWRAHITKDYKKYNLGRFQTLHAAKVAYNTKAKELFGEFARLNPL